MPSQAFRQSSFLGGVLSPALYGRTDLPLFAHSLRELRNFIVKQEGSAVNRAGWKYLAGTYTNLAARMLPFVFSRSKSYLLVLTNLRCDVYKNGVAVHNFVTPWVTADLPSLKWTQSGTVMTVDCAGYQPREIVFTGPADTDWVLNTVSVIATQAAPTGLAIAVYQTADTTHPAKEWNWAVCAVDANNRESLPSTTAGGSYAVYTDKPVKLTWSAAAGSPAYYNVYRGRNGKYGYVGSTTNLFFYDDGLYPMYSDPPPLDRNPFSGASDKPQCVTYHQQRIVHANTLNDPAGLWASVLGSFYDFNYASPPKDTDAWWSGVASRRYEEIRSMVPLAHLILLTNAGEWLVGSDGPFSPNSATFVPLSYWGSAFLDPVVVGGSILFLQERGSQIRELIVGPDAAESKNDLTVLASHLFEGRTIVSMDYAEVPFRMLVAVRDDGKIAQLTYLKQNNLIAWSWWDTAIGSCESVCVVPEGSEDVVYGIFNNGGSRWICRLASRLIATKADAALLDFHVTYNGAPTSTISGLAHLNGRTDVYALADGLVQGPFTVSAGSITLTTPASKVCAGLRYTGQLEVLDLATGAAEVRPLTKSVDKVFFEVHQSGGGFQVGETLAAQLVTAPSIVADANGFQTGLVEVLPKTTWNRDGRACIQQLNPLPLTVLSVIREVEMTNA